MRTLFLAGFLSLLLTACQSSPANQYYLLSALPAETTPAPGEPEMLIGIGPVEVADYLKRLKLSYQQENGKLLIQNHQYWAEPMDKGISRVIGLNLSSLNQNRGITLLPTRTSAKPHLSLEIQIHELNTINSVAQINANWQLIDNRSDQTILIRNFIRSIPVETNNDSMVQTYSDLFIELATEMDQALNNLPKDNPE